MTKFYGRAEEVVKALTESFENGTVAAPLAQTYLDIGDIPMSKWSQRNRFFVYLFGCTDARGYRQWQEVDRQVRKGEKARAAILVPLTKKGEDSDGEEYTYIYGYKGVPVFDVSQTDGEPLERDEQVQEFVSQLPLVQVAEKWGISVDVYDGAGSPALGYYAPGIDLIALGVENLSTWLHELVHVADKRLGNKLANDPVSETVAELGGAVLAHLIGRADAADEGGCWQYIQRQAAKTGQDPVDLIWQTVNRTLEAVNEIVEAAGLQEEETYEVTRHEEREPVPA